MIDAKVLDMKPHPDQATHNPGCWAVKLRVSHEGKARTFWRWFTVREDAKRKPTAHEVLERFWSDTFGELHGFDFEEITP